MSLNDSLHEDGFDSQFDNLNEPLTRGPAGARAPPYPPAQDYTANSTRYRDPVFAVLFLGHLAVVAFFAAAKGIPALAAGGIPEVEIDKSGAQQPDEADQPVPLVLGLSLMMVLGAFFSTVWIKILITHGESLIRWTLLSTVVWFVLCSVAAAFARSTVGSIMLLVSAGISYSYYRSIDSRIEFAGKNLKVACTAISAMPGTMTAAVALLAVQALWCMVWSLALLWLVSSVVRCYGYTAPVVRCTCVRALSLSCALEERSSAPSSAGIGVATNYSQKYITGADGVRYAAATCTTYSTVGPDPSFNLTCSGESQLCFKCICGSTVALPDSECLHYSVNASVYSAMLLSLLWGCAVTAAAAHCTAAGAVAGWWFSGATSSGGYSGNGQ
eukprot:7168-Heterococcus_DN1.PRE.2